MKCLQEVCSHQPRINYDLPAHRQCKLTIGDICTNCCTDKPELWFLEMRPMSNFLVYEMRPLFFKNAAFFSEYLAVLFKMRPLSSKYNHFSSKCGHSSQNATVSQKGDCLIPQCGHSAGWNAATSKSIESKAKKRQSTIFYHQNWEKSLLWDKHCTFTEKRHILECLWRLFLHKLADFFVVTSAILRILCITGDEIFNLNVNSINIKALFPAL